MAINTMYYNVIYNVLNIFIDYLILQVLLERKKHPKHTQELKRLGLKNTQIMYTNTILHMKIKVFEKVNYLKLNP